MRTAPAVAVLCAAALLVGAAGLPLEAHKPITSPYTFNEDVFPILRARCGGCHVAGGVAPMPLTTAEETVPWGESIRLELVAGHMPPWAALSNGARVTHAEGLTARELNVVLTWVTGGTPPGAADKALAPIPAMNEWRLGAPDLIVRLPEVTLAVSESETTREFVVPLDAAARRPLRAVDLLPGTPAVVRSARVSIRGAGALGDLERTLAVWVPGDAPLALAAEAAFAASADGELVVRVRYKKTWQHEREVMTDRSAVGLYFATDRAEPLRAWPVLMPDGAVPPAAGVTSGVVFGRVLDAGVRAMAIYPTEAIAGATITVDAVVPSGLRQRVIGFTPRPGWERRYWFDAPLEWPRGTRLEIALAFDADGTSPSSDASLAGRVPPAAGTPILIINTIPLANRR
jgi:hypothetical protein